MAKRKEKPSKVFRRNERMHVASVRYALKHNDYMMALRSLGWALQQSTMADAAESVERRGAAGGG